MATYYSDMVNRRTAVYRCYNEDGTLLYVGITMSPEGRFASHRGRSWWSQVTDIDMEWHGGREAAKSAEREAISTENPLHNVARPTPMPRLRVREAGV